MVRGDHAAVFFQQAGHFDHGGGARTVHVVNARPDFVRVTEIAKASQQLHVETAGFDRDDVDVHR